MIIQDLFDYSFPILYRPKGNTAASGQRLSADMQAIMSDIDDSYPGTGTGVRFTSAFRWSPDDDRALLGTMSYYARVVPEVVLELYVDKFCRNEFKLPMRNTAEKLYLPYKDDVREKLVADIPHTTDDFLVVSMPKHDCFMLLKLKKGTNSNFDYVFSNMLKSAGVSVTKQPMKISPDAAFQEVTPAEINGQDEKGKPTIATPKGYWLKSISLKPHAELGASTSWEPYLDGLTNPQIDLMRGNELIKEFVIGFDDKFEFTFDKKCVLTSYEIVGDDFRNQWFSCDSEAFAGEGIYLTLDALLNCLEHLVAD